MDFFSATDLALLRELARPRGVLDEVNVVDLAGQVELGEEQGIHVPELGLDERARNLLEAEAERSVFLTESRNSR